MSGNLFLQGKYLEIGAQGDGSLGSSVSPPSGYHPDCSYYLCGASNSLASVYDWGHDGWTTGTPNYMGDYTLPGSPWEEWDIEANGTTYYASSTTCSPTGTLSGSFTSFYHTTGTLGSYYSTYGSSARGLWSGSISGCGLAINKEYRVDTFGCAVVVTVVLTNTTATPITGVYYMRTCDPDNDVCEGGSYTTDNVVAFQNDYYHRVMVTAYATGSTSATGIPAQPISIGTKDCRAKALIFGSWPLSTSCDLAAIWAETATCIGTSYYTVNVNSPVAGDIAIALCFNLGTIAAHDSTLFSYAYIYNGSLGLDSAFPAPKMMIGGTGYDSFALLTACGTSLGDTLPINILYGTDKSWSWSTWTWTGPSGAMGALLTDTGVVGGIIVPSLTGTTTYTITGTQANGSCVQKQFVITIVPSSLGAPGVADVYYCQGATAATLTASGVNLLWYTSATGGTGTTTAPTPSTSTVGVTYYYVSQNPCGIESSRSRIAVYVTPRPVIHAGSNSPICAGSTLDLYGNDTFTTGHIVYGWSGPAAFSSALQNPSISPAVAADSGIYIVTLSVNGCVALPDTEMVVVHAAPPAPGVVSVTYCQFDSAVPVSVTGSNLLWYPTATGGAGTPGIILPNTSIAGTTTYYYTQTTNGCESPRAALTVTINAKPPRPTAVDPTYCQGDLPTALSATGSGLLWYGPGITGSTIAPTPSTATPGITDYYVTQTVLGCVSDRQSIPVTIIPKPAPPVVADSSYCQGATAVPLTATGTSIEWYTTPAGGTALTTTPIPNTTSVGSTTWYATQTVTGCESDRAAETVTILYQPVFTITSSRPYVCEFDTLTFNYNGPTLVDPTYNWSLPVGGTFVSGVASDPSIVARFDSLYLQNVTLTAGDYGGRCHTSVTVPVHVVYQPGAAATVSTNQNLCSNDTITVALSSHTDNANSYSWNFDGAAIISANSNSGGPYSISWADSGIHIITLTAYSVEGCAGVPTYDTIDVHSVPFAGIVSPTILEKSFCMEDSVRLDAADSTHEGYSYTWSPAHFFESTGRSWAWGRIEMAGWVTLTVTDPFGCIGVDSVYLSPESCCTVFFPTAFTPNGDGHNDHFRPVFKGGTGLGITGSHEFDVFRITNRWGQTVFESNNSSAEWDGTLGGVPQDMGTYYYFIKYTCTDGPGGSSASHIQKGEVTLIR